MVYAVLNERNSVCFHPTARTLCFVVINRRKQSGKQNQFDQPLDVFIAMTLPNISLKLFSTLMYMLSSIVCVCVCVFSFDRSIIMCYSSVVTDKHRFFLVSVNATQLPQSFAALHLFSDQKRFSTFGGIKISNADK